MSTEDVSYGAVPVPQLGTELAVVGFVASEEGIGVVPSCSVGDQVPEPLSGCCKAYPW
jgi:hypothetical protein